MLPLRELAKRIILQHLKGGKLVESGAYHLEFVAEKEATGTHLDFYLQKGDKHEPVPNAKVSAKVQLRMENSKP